MTSFPCTKFGESDRVNTEIYQNSFNHILEIENITLEKFLTDRNIKFKDAYLKYDFLAIPKSPLTIEEISIIKEIREIKENNKFLILNSTKLSYTDFRGGDYEFMTIAISEYRLSLLLAVISNLLTNKIITHRKREKLVSEHQSIPKVHLCIFRINKDELITIKGEVNDVLKVLDMLRETIVTF